MRHALRFALAGVAILVPVGVVLAVVARATAPSPPPRQVTVALVYDAADGGDFRPAILRVAPGTEVTWIEQDHHHLHTVTAYDSSFGSTFLRPGARYTVRFNKPGVYRYYCEIHRHMTGEVIVQ